MQPSGTVERLRKLNSLLDEALDIPAERRDAWLDGLPAELQSLGLAKYQHQGGLHAQARVSVADALANLEATLDADHRLIREARELAARIVSGSSPTAARTTRGR